MPLALNVTEFDPEFEVHDSRITSFGHEMDVVTPLGKCVIEYMLKGGEWLVELAKSRLFSRRGLSVSVRPLDCTYWVADSGEGLWRG